MTRALRRTAPALATLAVGGAAAFWLLSRPSPLPPAAVPAHEVDLRKGETLYHAGSCLACHKAPEGAPGADRGLPAGGTPFRTPVGVFYPQNLTPDGETGLGRWSEVDFVNALRLGISPRGTHYFPAFPYTSYRSMTMTDLLDLRAYLMSLPAVRSPSREADVPLVAPLVALARRAVGLWKRIAFRQPAFSPAPGRPPSWTRGAYLANAPGHCGECHTPKDWLMVADESRHMAGGPHPGGEGKVPSLRGLVARKKYTDVDDLVLALQNGETLGYEHLSSGGMAAIQENLARLPESDVRAIAGYLLSLQ
jgi:mono/diheme cytochrome c family protein